MRSFWTVSSYLYKPSAQSPATTTPLPILNLFFQFFLAGRNQCKELCIEFSNIAVDIQYSPERQNQDITSFVETAVSLSLNISPDLERNIMDVFSSFSTIVNQSFWTDEIIVSFNLKFHHEEDEVRKDTWLRLFDSLSMLKTLEVDFRWSEYGGSEMTSSVILALMEPACVNDSHNFRCAKLEQNVFNYSKFPSSGERAS